MFERAPRSVFHKSCIGKLTRLDLVTRLSTRRKAQVCAATLTDGQTQDFDCSHLRSLNCSARSAFNSKNLHYDILSLLFPIHIKSKTFLHDAFSSFPIQKRHTADPKWKRQGTELNSTEKERERSKVWLHFELMLTKCVAIKQQFFSMHYCACTVAFFFHSVGMSERCREEQRPMSDRQNVTTKIMVMHYPMSEKG